MQGGHRRRATDVLHHRLSGRPLPKGRHRYQGAPWEKAYAEYRSTAGGRTNCWWSSSSARSCPPRQIRFVISCHPQIVTEESLTGTARRVRPSPVQYARRSTSNSWLRAGYGKRLRRFFAERHTPLRWLDLGKDVFESAIVDSGVLLLRTVGGKGAAFPAVDMDRLPGVGFPPDEGLWGRISPAAKAPWSLLSLIEQSVVAKMRTGGEVHGCYAVGSGLGPRPISSAQFVAGGAARGVSGQIEARSDVAVSDRTARPIGR